MTPTWKVYFHVIVVKSVPTFHALYLLFKNKSLCLMKHLTISSRCCECSVTPYSDAQKNEAQVNKSLKTMYIIYKWNQEQVK